MQRAPRGQSGLAGSAGGRLGHGVLCPRYVRPVQDFYCYTQLSAVLGKGEARQGLQPAWPGPPLKHASVTRATAAARVTAFAPPPACRPRALHPRPALPTNPKTQCSSPGKLGRQEGRVRQVIPAATPRA